MNDKRTILIVDDDALVRDTLEGLLIAQGHELAFASNGSEALVKAAELMPDLILLDIMMPDMDGFEVCQRLRADSVLAQVPVIMVTALDDRESRLQGILVGADDFVTKPFDSVELQLRVQTIARLNRYRRLLMERNKFEWVVEQAEDGYLMLSNHDRILYANPQACLLLGCSTETIETLSETFLELVKKQYICEPDAAWNTWPELPEIEVPRYLVRAETSTAYSFWLQVDLVKMSPQSSEQYLVRLRDITKNVMAERLMWSFQDQVSHKLRTPLTKLLGFVELLKEERSPQANSDEYFLLTTVSENAKQLQEEVASIFQYMNTVNLNKPGQSYCRLAEISAIINKIKTDLEIDSLEITTPEIMEALGATSISTPCQALELILWELVENAIKFHPSRSPTLEVKISRVSNSISIQIRDDGLTLSPEQLAKMWIPYYQAEKYFSGQVPGMGLGLSMVATLAWSAGGSCRSYNREDSVGIVIEIILPLKNSPA